MIVPQAGGDPLRPDGDRWAFAETRGAVQRFGRGFFFFIFAM